MRVRPRGTIEWLGLDLQAVHERARESIVPAAAGTYHLQKTFRSNFVLGYFSVVPPGLLALLAFCLMPLG
jgi:hypothetical protein